jgi:hypothetical protein
MAGLLAAYLDLWEPFVDGNDGGSMSVSQV